MIFDVPAVGCLMNKSRRRRAKQCRAIEKSDLNPGTLQGRLTYLENDLEDLSSRTATEEIKRILIDVRCCTGNQLYSTQYKLAGTETKRNKLTK
jgi:citrate synthase